MSFGDFYCRKFLGYVPSFTPIVRTLSSNVAYTNAYNDIYITGENFLPYDSTYVELENVSTGKKTKVIVAYNSSTSINFIVPLALIAAPASYFLRVINIYNGNLSLGVLNTYPPALIPSNTLDFDVEPLP